jgi:hypothetical protein
MQSNSKIKLLLGLAIALIAIALIVHLSSAPKEISRADLEPTNAVSHSAPKPNIARPAIAPPETSTPEEIGPIGLPKLPREKVEDYLRENHRNAPSLLAAFHALDDTNYLHEAATNFSNDPQVQWTVLARNVFPEERRKWLDAFKASSPDNSLANYLSAREYFKNGQAEAALRELEVATGKKQFKDYAIQAQFDIEELGALGGLDKRSSLTMGMAAAAGDLLPYLSNMKGLGQDIAGLQKQYATSGDVKASAAATQVGLSLAGRLQEGDGSKFLINQLIGYSLQAIALQNLDQNAPCDFLGGQTPAQQLSAMKERRTEYRKLQEGLTAALMTLSDAEWSAYAQRQKVYGEVEAMRWLQQKLAAASPNGK